MIRRRDQNGVHHGNKPSHRSIATQDRKNGGAVLPYFHINYCLSYVHSLTIYCVRRRSNYSQQYCGFSRAIPGRFCNRASIGSVLSLMTSKKFMILQGAILLESSNYQFLCKTRIICFPLSIFRSKVLIGLKLSYSIMNISIWLFSQIQLHIIVHSNISETHI